MSINMLLRFRNFWYFVDLAVQLLRDIIEKLCTIGIFRLGSSVYLCNSNLVSKWLRWEFCELKRELASASAIVIKYLKYRVSQNLCPVRCFSGWVKGRGSCVAKMKFHISSLKNDGVSVRLIGQHPFLLGALVLFCPCCFIQFFYYFNSVARILFIINFATLSCFIIHFAIAYHDHHYFSFEVCIYNTFSCYCHILLLVQIFFFKNFSIVGH